MLPLSLYVHMPWCLRKCPYCDFNSHAHSGTLPETDYIRALMVDLKNDLALLPHNTIHSLFIGGGTPSMISPKAYAQLFDALNQVTSFPDNLEITLEANPGTVDEQRFKAYRQIGINRLSLGIQSFNAAHLKTLGRIHDGKQAHTAIQKARQAGFEHLNIDLMYGLPNQTPAQSLNDLKTAMSYEPSHLSWYQLTIEPNTLFYNHPPSLPSEENIHLMEANGLEALQVQHYERYEISAFSKEHKACTHNLNYWLFGDYIGIGAGAHGKLTLVDEQTTIYRTQKYRQPKDYLSKNPAFSASKRRLAPGDLIFEFMLNTTRLEQAIPKTLFTERTGLPEDLLTPKLLQAHQAGWIRINNTHWQVTPFGRRYTNDLQALFLPD